MALIEIPDLDQDYEGKPVPEGEYSLRCVSCEKRQSKADKPMLQIMIVVDEQVEGVPNINPINHFISLAQKKDDTDTKSFKMQMLTRFLVCFGIPFEADGFAEEDIVGATANCFVEQDEPNDNGDIYNSLRLPRVK
jgi:hypothetical protein|tara:strand:+ start:796 stop:1203 length:408 start_codon:yes stop_codon:yes gene_type:complete